MNLSMIRLIPFLLIAGCSLPAINLPVTGEAKLFAEGLDYYITTNDTTTLEQLPLLYPEGNWRNRAESILDMAEALHQHKSLELQQKTLLEMKDQEIKNCLAYKSITGNQDEIKTSEELGRCVEEKNALMQDNKMLEATLNQLKEVLIDTELKAK
jgi:small-conductance mechanosensitive channel